ncbi:phage tail termination protein [Streptomyces chrestomyceticus]
MTTPILPDIEALTLAAIRARLPGIRVVVDIPSDWDATRPLIVAHRVGGAAEDARFLDRALMDVQVWYRDRRYASMLARTVRMALADACRDQFSDIEGALSSFTEVSGPWCPGPEDDTGLTRFIATYQLTARPAHRKEM